MPNIITKSEKVALTDQQIKDWCKKTKIPCEIVNLNSLQESLPKSRFAFIFTGNKDDKFNNGHPHHWLACDGQYFFDSYGKHDYQIPEEYKQEQVKTEPRQLQAYGSCVCGEYCCLFVHFAYTNRDEPWSAEELGSRFSQEYSFGSNREHNDRTVLEVFAEFLQPTTESKQE